MQIFNKCVNEIKRRTNSSYCKRKKKTRLTLTKIILRTKKIYIYREGLQKHGFVDKEKWPATIFHRPHCLEMARYRHHDWRLSQPPLLLVSPDNAEWTHSSLRLIFHFMSWLPLREMERAIMQTDKGMWWPEQSSRGALCMMPSWILLLITLVAL